jgi:hypothetical protein
MNPATRAEKIVELITINEELEWAAALAVLTTDVGDGVAG